MRDREGSPGVGLWWSSHLELLFPKEGPSVVQSCCLGCF